MPRMTPEALSMIRKVVKIMTYVGLCHTAFTAMGIYRTHGIELLHYALISPGLYYAIPLAIACLGILIFENRT